MSLPIIYEDAESLVIDKPAGLPVDHPRAGGESLEARLDELRLGFARAPAAVHRLDRDTSGCLLLARNPKALRRFAAAFEAREVAKSYLAIVTGDVPDEGEIDLPLTKTSSAEAGWRIIPSRAGKPARTHWQRLATAGDHRLLLLTPETGRTHQLRVHLASGLDRPIVGDAVYGAAHPGGMMLHAWRLVVPRAGKPPIRAEAPLPARFAAFGFGPESLEGIAFDGLA
ncbi:RluA family pseudouridine synthase [Sphingomonas sp. AP4-R1]|uniref:RluA family pseudouridine synthase n=1 Tax=Sphingomonas sp. AP4-R1 TaxID=2735134 RepID=UPI0014934C6B|nr:RluA family pseudouridine synthase [Sphingomonas sp. AP4-R1]QJU56771.1 RluA family pseudouridine synthase [Sphingomonas sp. AP4-R1]